MKVAATGFELAPDETAALRSLAYRSGTVLERDGAAVYAFGEAQRFELSGGLADGGGCAEVEAALAEVRASSSPRPPLAVGSLPFRPDAPARIVLPEVTVVATGGGAVAIVAGPRADRTSLDRLVAEAATPCGGEPPPDSFTLASTRSHADFLSRVRAAVEEVRTGRLDKVVLAREVRIEANRPLHQHDLLERLRALHPSCLAFAVSGFVGASPELLLARSGSAVASGPLAGTAARSGDPEADRRAESELLSSEKDRAEHRAVVEAIAAGLRPVAADLDVPDEPHVVALRNVSHLGTRITGELLPSAPGALGLLALIHPTPAVAGSPTDVALEYLAKVEDVDRDRYAGAVGWVDASGDGEWYLGIRSAVVEGTSARLFAGVGIVADSDPEAELRETQLKLQAVLAATVWP